MSEWTPKPRLDAKTEGMSLTGEEGFVLSRVDGATSVKGLVNLTGLPEGRVRQILQKLVQEGAVEDLSGAASAGAPPRRAPAPAPAPGGSDALSPEELATLLDDYTVEEELPALAPRTDHDGNDGNDGRPDEDLAGSANEGEDAASEGDEDGSADDEEKLDDTAEGNFRRLFNETLAKLEAPLRESMAKAAKDPELSALCFDPLPAVIKGVLENPASGFQQARLVARHHHTPQGLDFVMGRAEFFRDGQTQRLLLQNTMLQEPQLKRLLQSKRLADVYKVTVSREIPERNRQKARQVLRGKWSVSEAEERAGLVFVTEGRCLAQLTGLPFDSRTTSMLCSKTYTSNLLIQNLARFGATPPPVLAHLLKQQTVRRQQMLKNIILQHPNCPAEAKRRS